VGVGGVRGNSVVSPVVANESRVELQSCLVPSRLTCSKPGPVKSVEVSGYHRMISGLQDGLDFWSGDAAIARAVVYINIGYHN